jgi:hypothetical protein
VAPGAPSLPPLDFGSTPRLKWAFERVRFFRSAPLTERFSICLPVMTVAAVALPAHATTSATIAMTVAGEGGRSRRRLMPR